MTIECFISHSWQYGEHNFAVSLVSILRENNLNAWIDEERIPGGGHIQDRIVAGVEICDVFLFVMSPSSVKSRWCLLELEEAVKQRDELGVQIIPICLKDCDIPNVVKDLLFVDFRQQSKFEHSVEHLLKGIQTSYQTRSAIVNLLEGDESERRKAAEQLAYLKDRFSIPILARRLHGEPPPIEPDPTVRYWLAYGLGKIGGSDACVALLKAAKTEKNPFVNQGIKDGRYIAKC